MFRIAIKVLVGRQSTRTIATNKKLRAEVTRNEGVHNTIASNPLKPLSAQKKRSNKKKNVLNPNILAFATCEEYNLDNVSQFLNKQGLYAPKELPEESEALYAQAIYPIDEQERDIFIFEDGAVVFWNFTKVEAKNVLSVLKAFESNPYNSEIILDEHESMEFQFHNGKTRISNGKALMSSGNSNGDGQDNRLSKYAISNGVALSVKLAIWETKLEEFIASIESMLEDITHGRKLSVTRSHMFKKTGELFALRHHLNLSSDLLDTPDFYWDRDELELIFGKVRKNYSIERRTKVMNEKIEHCQELLELISHHLEDNHHVRLELMIIILIVVEVMFECIHYIERFTSE